MVELRAYTSAYGARLAHGLGSNPSAGTSFRMITANTFSATKLSAG